MKTIHLAALSATLGLALGQGSLTPPGAPAPTMKTLQEIWDKIESVETKNAALEKQNEELQQMVVPIYEKLGISLPWVIQTVDSEGDVGAYCSLAIDPSGHPAIAYYDATNRNLNYASHDGTSWSVEIARESPNQNYDYGKHASLAFSPAGEPGISFFSDMAPQDLNYSARIGGSWTWTTVDGYGTGSTYGLHTSLAFDPQGHQWIAYQDGSQQDLRCASFDGTDYTIHVVSSTGNVGQYTSLVMLPSGKVAISFHDASNGDLKYAEFDGSGWVVSTVDAIGNVGRYTSMAVDTRGHPAIAYYDVVNTDLKYASFNGIAWTVVTAIADTTKDIGKYASLAFSPSGHPAISCFVDTSPNDLALAVFDGSSWSYETVDGVGTNDVLGHYSSLAFSPAGQPMIAYYDATNGDLKFATKAPFHNP